MKAKLNRSGIITIKAETISEGFTLKCFVDKREQCETCGFPKGLILFDHRILDKKKKSDPITER